MLKNYVNALGASIFSSSVVPKFLKPLVTTVFNYGNVIFSGEFITVKPDDLSAVVAYDDVAKPSVRITVLGVLRSSANFAVPYFNGYHDAI